MTTLMQASRQWASRPADERYASLLDMQSYMTRRRDRSRAAVESTRALTVLPDQSDPLHRGLFLGIERGPLAANYWHRRTRPSGRSAASRQRPPRHRISARAECRPRSSRMR